MDFNCFDVAAKEMVWDDPVAWLERFGIACANAVDVIDSDITTLTAAADKVIRVAEPEPYLKEGRQEGEGMGRVREAQRFLRLLGMRRFDPPNSAIDAVLEAIDDVDRLEALGVRIVEPDLQGWDDLLRDS